MAHSGTKPTQSVLYYLQYHWQPPAEQPTAQPAAPRHRPALSIIRADRAHAAAMAAAKKGEVHPFATLYHGTEADCQTYRSALNATLPRKNAEPT